MFKKVKKAFSKCKAFVVCALAVVSICAMAVVASAETSTPVVENSVDTTSMFTEAGNQLTSQFSSMVSTIIPVVLGILGTGLVIFGIIKLVKLAKKIFGSVAG